MHMTVLYLHVSRAPSITTVTVTLTLHTSSLTESLSGKYYMFRTCLDAFHTVLCSLIVLNDMIHLPKYIFYPSTPRRRNLCLVSQISKREAISSFCSMDPKYHSAELFPFAPACALLFRKPVYVTPKIRPQRNLMM
jgi:hypothetical protein